LEPYSAVTSVQNSMVKHAHSLTVPKKLKESEDFLCEGYHLLREALESELKIRYVLSTESASRREEGRELFALAGRKKVRWVTAGEKILQYLSDQPSPQGLAAVVKKPEFQWPHETTDLVLAVHGVQDPGNLGALLRTAEAAGAGGIVLAEGCCDPFNPKSVRAAMGSLFRLPVQSGVAWRDAQAQFKAGNLQTVALMPRGSVSLAELKPERRVYWVGAEGEGLPQDLSEACDLQARIEMKGRVESLNVSASAAIALFYKGFRGPVS